MTSQPDLATLKEHRNWLLQTEVCSLLHDLGKLSADFIHYRQTWYTSNPSFFGDDPHEQEFLTSDKLLPSQLASLKDHKSFKTPRGDEWYSPNSVMKSHVYPPDASVFEQALKRGDGMDAAQDRNNPLWSAEQNDRVNRTAEQNAARDHFFRSNVFGHEGCATRVETASLDDRRRELYNELAEKNFANQCWEQPASAKDRFDLLEILKKYFEYTCSDTTRPGNDTSLWEHVYAVTSLTKALQVHYLLYGDGADPKDYFGWNSPATAAPFMIWGVGWDALQFIGRGQRLHDLAARRNLLANIRRNCRKVVEHDHALGNAVYEDDDCALFLIPAIETTGCGEPYKALLESIKQDLFQAALEASGGEVCPHFRQSKPTADTCDTADVLHKLRKADRAPAHAFIPNFEAEVKKAARIEGEIRSDVCSICGLRPGKPLEGEADKARVCTACRDRRVAASRKAREDTDQTLFLNEIADHHGRLALLVGRFGLDQWLNGKMIRSLFVTEAHGLGREVRELGHAAEFRQQEGPIQTFLKSKYGTDFDKYNFTRIREQLQAIHDDPNSDLARNTCFLYDRRTSGEDINTDPTALSRKLNAGIFSDEINPVNAKSPTPSSILDVWQSTQEFAQSVCRERQHPGERRPALLDTVFQPKSRTKLEAQFEAANLNPFQVYTARLGDQVFELYCDDDRNSIFVTALPQGVTAEQLVGQTVTLETETALQIGARMKEGDIHFRPMREIIATPEMFLALVPAEHALAATAAITTAWNEQFGKVWGRLPFSIGHIFFELHTPMFIVLDTARRMLDNFAALDTQSEKWQIACRDGSTLHFTNGMKVEIPTLLGDGTPDYYHPYQIVPAANESSGDSYFPTPVGPVLHVSDLKAGMDLEVAPSKYDYIYLDTTSSRFKPLVPVRLEALPQQMETLWDTLRSAGLTDSALRQFIAALETKSTAWDTANDDAAKEEWRALAKHLADALTKDEAARAQIMASLYSGLFFTTTRLYLQALKERIEAHHA